jgi:DUF4097 and DUF4098 domain-containing protein YvlB
MVREVSTTEPRRGLPRPFVGTCVVVAILVAAWAGLSVVSLTTRQTETTSHTYPAGGPLQLTAQSGDVTIVAQDRDDVRVDSRARWSLSEPDVRLRRENGRLVLDGECGFWGQVGPGSCSTNFEIYVPRGTEVEARTSSGDMRVVDLDADVRLRTSSGDVEAEGVGGQLTLDSSSGDVGVVGFRGRDVGAHTSSGDVTVRAETVPDRVDARTSSGDVTVAVPDAVYDVETNTSSGDEDVQVSQDPDARNVIEARTSSGDVAIVRLDDAR